jgi:hypothetical protein
VDYLSLTNLLFSITIVTLGIKRYFQHDVKAFLFIGLAYVLFGFSHLSMLAGWDFKAVLSAVRAGGYVLVIVGLLL